MAGFFKRALSALTSGLCLMGAAGLPSSLPAAVYAADILQEGSVDGYFYQYWIASSIGECDYENTENNGFSYSCRGVEDSIVTKGKKFEDEKIFASQLREYNVTYDADIDYMGMESWSGVYGWMVDPNIEFFIIDSWGKTAIEGTKFLGSFESNGITYDMYYHRKYQMDFLGTKYTPTYYSIAQKNLADNVDGTCNIKNTVNISDHLKAWNDAGLDLGYMYEAGFSVDIYRSDCDVKLNSLDITSEITDDANFGPEFAYKKHEPAEPDEEGRSVYIDFETENESIGADDEKCRASYETEHSFSGERSMLISAEGKSTRTLIYEIDPFDFKGRKMLGGVRLYHSSDKDVRFSFEILRRDIQGREERRDKSFKSIAPDHWASMDLLAFSLDNDVYTKYYIVITASEPVDFYADDLYIYDAEYYEEFISAEKYNIRGDINNDKSVDIFDMIALRRELLDAGEPMIDALHDVNGDYKLNVCDLVLLTQFVLGKTDSVPEPDIKAEYHVGPFSDSIDEDLYIFSSTTDNSQNIKTVICEDGTYMSQWGDIKYYDILKSRSIDDFDEISVKCSGEVKTVSVQDNDIKPCVYVITSAKFVNAGKAVEVCVIDGADKESRLNWLPGYNKMENVNIDGTDYYLSKPAETSDDMYDDYVIRLFTKDNTVECDKKCSFEMETDFTDILKYLGMEELRPSEVTCSVMIKNNSGYIDINEMSFIDKSREA